MAAPPPLAVVLVTHDSGDELPATLAALAPQLGPADEVVVVDCASAEEPTALVERCLPGARTLVLGDNRGFAGGAVAGAEATRAPLLFFLNPDALLAPGCLDALRRAAEARPAWGAWQALVTLPGGERINTSGGVTHWLGLAWAGECDLPVEPGGEELREVSFASGAALCVRREAWDAVGGFDPAYFMYCEDVDLSLRLRLAGWGVGTVRAARVEHAYSFAKGDYKWFYMERNRWWTILGTYPAPLLALLAPALLAFEVGLLAIAWRGGWAAAKLRAQAAVLRGLPWALARRRRVQALRAVDAERFAAGLSAALDSPYLGGAVRVPGVEPLQRAYWRLVTALVSGRGLRAPGGA